MFYISDKREKLLHFDKNLDFRVLLLALIFGKVSYSSISYSVENLPYSQATLLPSNFSRIALALS